MTTTFGWCLDGHHHTCPVLIGGADCSCPCHSMRVAPEQAFGAWENKARPQVRQHLTAPNHPPLTKNERG